MRHVSAIPNSEGNAAKNKSMSQTNTPTHTIYDERARKPQMHGKTPVSIARRHVDTAAQATSEALGAQAQVLWHAKLCVCSFDDTD